ncbi:phosphoribosylformylglycinamidine synthase subunit PurQ [Coprothermobacter platensis]|uniref:phosphoribosylformylglycinamidine synthase subunit PurQ n=1 Tax=Coprothermobacter platensis TaxID=108819 RepID=UPI000360B4E8|nr:phosphoribosylformylglycinamidine synthase subunit PurQ [Coprothermobacter platensis]
MKKFGIIVLPGSNCDSDCFYAVRDYLEQDAEYVWHEENNLDRYDVLMIPGGFSYGDYLRPGALARFSPAVQNLVKEAEKGKLIIGICNGFQILTELGLLPGALMRNKNLKFICKHVTLKVEKVCAPFTSRLRVGQRISLPIAHKDGNYYASDAVLEELNRNEQILLRYDEDVNGSVQGIAAIISKEGNVLGMMPHPERACDSMLGNTDGMYIFGSVLDYLTKRGQ